MSRRFFFLAMALIAASCATSPPAATPAATPSQTHPAVNPIAGLLQSAGPQGPTLEAVTAAMGEPDLRRQDGAGAALTYRYDDCALLLLFAADPANAMRLAEAHPGPKRAGEAAPSLDQCAVAATARRAR